MVTTKSYMQLNQCLVFEPHEPYVILAEYEMYLRLPLHFIWIKIPDRYQSVVPVDLELSPKERSAFPLFAIQGYIFYIKFVIY